MTYATDIDVLHWEPNIFNEAAFASQTLLSGNGTLTGTSFTIASGSFLAANVATGQVIVLTGSIAGCFPIVSVDSATQLTLSVLYDSLFPSPEQPEASPIGEGTELSFSVRTFRPQMRVVSALLRQAAGLAPDEEEPDPIRNPETLRRPCVLGTLQMIYGAMAAAGGSADLGIRAELYERLYRRSLAGVRVELDLNGDGHADTIRQLSVLRLVRT